MMNKQLNLYTKYFNVLKLLMTWCDVTPLLIWYTDWRGCTITYDVNNNLVYSEIKKLKTCINKLVVNSPLFSPISSFSSGKGHCFFKSWISG